MSRGLFSSLAMAAALACSVSAQQPASPALQAGRGAAPRVTRPPLFFAEEWKQTPAGDEHPVTQQSVANPALDLKLYGTTAKEIQLTGAPGNENNPTHVWTGMCATPCALAFKHKTNYADLTGLARVRWNTKTSGFHQIRPIVKLVDGTWLVGDYADGTTRDWLVSEFSLADVRWLRLDIERVVTTGNIVERPDLSKVDEIGFADLMPGSGHGAGGWSDVAQIEVFARPIPRPGSSTAQ